MDSERSVLSSALTSGSISTLLARGIEVKHFTNTKSGEECRNVFSFAAHHARKYGVSPSQQIVKANFPNWHGEPSSDPLEALIDQFLNDVRRRYFSAKVMELAQAQGNPANWGKLDEIMLDAARDLATVIPSGQVSRVRAEMQERIDQYEIDKAEGKKSGILCGIPLFDDLTDGFQQGDIVTVAGYSGRGKALDLNTPVPTPDGWTTMGEIQAGDYVFGADGKPTLVLNAWPILHNRKCYEVTFSDGSNIIADAEHLWEAYDWTARGSESRQKRKVVSGDYPWNDQTHLCKKPRVLTTDEILSEMNKDHRKWSIPCAKPVEYPEQDLSIDPYIFGYWLGDGNSNSACITVDRKDLMNLVNNLEITDEEFRIHDDHKNNVVRVTFGHQRACKRGHSGYKNSAGCVECQRIRIKCKKENIDINEIYPMTVFTAQERLRQMGVLHNKHIPFFYLESSVRQRLSLLQGIMDSDGHVQAKTGKCEISITNRYLAEGILELSLSLGFRATMTERAAKYEGKEISRVYRISFVTDMEVCRLDRKREWLREDVGTMATHRYIDSIREVVSRPVRCIAVAADDKKFLVGEQFIATHNSMLSQFFLSQAIDQEKTGLLMSLEMSKRQIMDRFDTMITNFSHKQLRKKELSDEELDNWRRAAKKYEGAKNDLIVIDKPGNCTVDRIYAEINRYKPDITCVDYVQLMKGSKASAAKHEGLIEITNELKSVALATDSTIIMVSQDQRNSAEDGSTESNMGGSVSVYQAADIYIGMMQNQEMREQKKLTTRLIKNRNGSPGESDLMLDPEYMIFRPWDNTVNHFSKELIG